MIMLTLEQQNALIDICNTGMKHAVGQLSALLNTKIDITAPKIHLLDINSTHKNQLFSADTILSYVYQDMTQDIAGRALLIFQRHHAATLMSSVLSELPRLSDQEIRVCEREAMLEIGNIVISSCIHAIRCRLSCNIMLGFPKHAEDIIIHLLQTQLLDIHHVPSKMIVFDTKLETKDKKIFEKLLFILKLDSVAHLLEKVNQLL